MSHIVSIKTEVRDPAAVAAACRRLGLPEPVHGTARLFEGEATGLLVKLPGWLYPVVVRHRHRPGPLRQLRRAVGRRRSTSTASCRSTPWRRPSWRPARRATPSAEQALDDGSIRLQIIEAR